MQLTPSQPQAIWLDRFACQLGRLMPSLGPAAAWRYALGTFEEAADLDPIEAAEIFALELPPTDPGAPE